jgi:hypothetical protein
MGWDPVAVVQYISTYKQHTEQQNETHKEVHTYEWTYINIKIRLQFIILFYLDIHFNMILEGLFVINVVENHKTLTFKVSRQYLTTCGAWEQ